MNDNNIINFPKKNITECKSKQDIIDFLKVDKTFSTQQKKVIYASLDTDLPLSAIKLFGLPKYNSAQMAAISIGLQEGLPEDVVAEFIDAKFDPEQLEQILGGLKDQMDPELVSFYADERFDWAQMKDIRMLLKEIDDEFKTEEK